MTYSEAFLRDGPVSEAVEYLAHWLQWAEYGIMGGASENYDEIRYNLSRYWIERNEYYNNFSNDPEKRQIEVLDMYAHGLLDAVETGRIFSASPGYWAYLKAWYFGGVPPRPESDAAAAEAKQAALDAERAARLAGNDSFAEHFKRCAAEVDNYKDSANEFWKQAPVAPFGIPLWVWGAGLAGIVVLTVLPRGK
jgi:hypothetical protein